MRISELSRRSGVSIPSIKYYLREGLLPPGARTGRNQADYDETHLHRLRLIQALREVGGLSVAATQQVLQALDQPGLTGHELMGSAHRAVLRQQLSDRTAPGWDQARAEAAAWVRTLGWQVCEDAPALDQLADVLLTLQRLGRTELLDQRDWYAEAALAVASREVAVAAALPDPTSMLAAVVAGTVLGEALLTALRLLAHEHVSASLTTGPDTTGPDTT